ncbi:MAG: nitrite/sulfite reductase [Rhodospirillales bacterium]|nr:nitrite/sulfite reductase [Rhodospirillales bacterium]
MYQYDTYDKTLVDQRARQYRDQAERRVEGDLTEDEFRPLRLMNGLYQELHSYMMRINIPYGTLSSAQLRKLAHVARTYDRGYGHFTTRQNIQFNWVTLEQSPDILAELAGVEMHAIQSSGNCIRNVTADAFAGAAADEIEDSRIWAEIIRQWSTLHPEFAFLPRKFKIAVTGSPNDRAAIRVHDIGVALHLNAEGETGFEVVVGGGQGRTPMIAKTIREFLPARHLLSYLEAILRVYNQFGRRDNKYKARIKILVHEIGAQPFAEAVEKEWEQIKDSALLLPEDEVARITSFFAPPQLEKLGPTAPAFDAKRLTDRAFAAWAKANVVAHKAPGYGIVTISLKAPERAPGDATHTQMDAIADLADHFSQGEIRVTHEQNLVLPHVKLTHLFGLWQALAHHELATANAGLATDIVSCPGLDFCSLASARSIPVAQRIGRQLSDIERLHDIGELRIKISGCVNACGHHHVGHIGILGVEKKGEEFYQITLGGDPGTDAAIGNIIGPAFAGDRVAGAVENLIDTYLAQRSTNAERFIDTYRRIGAQPFKENLYATA